MNDDVFQDSLDFEVADDAAQEGQALILDIDGFEGPLHLLLELGRKQKVDITRISILELAEQYIAFIKTAQDLRIELAADYLVMAAWLAYLKSRLILPRDKFEDAEPEAEVLATHLAFRLQRLEAMRRAAEGLFKLKLMGQSTFMRGNPEGLRSRTTPLYQAELFDLIKSYGQMRSHTMIKRQTLRVPLVYKLEDARRRLARAVGTSLEWLDMESLLPPPSDFEEDMPRRSVRASALLAGLELAKEGKMELRQSSAFAPIFVRHKVQTDTDETPKGAELKEGQNHD